jgi:hypothetical protein
MVGSLISDLSFQGGDDHGLLLDASLYNPGVPNKNGIGSGDSLKPIYFIGLCKGEGDAEGGTNAHAPARLLNV